MEEARRRNGNSLKKFCLFSVLLWALKVPETLSAAPSAPPVNVTAYNTSSTSIQVSWSELPGEHQNGVILGYKVFYKSENNGQERSQTINNTSTLTTNLTGLQEFVKYSISVSAFNNKGDGNRSDAVLVFTAEDVPGAPPQNVGAHNKSSTKITVTWKNVVESERNGIILGFKIYYKAVGRFAVNRTMVVKKIDGENTTEAVLTGLEKYMEYKISVLAFTSKGDGPNSTKTATTDQDIPSAPPQSVVAQSKSSTEITVTWTNVAESERNGIILGFKIYYKAVGTFAVNRTMMVKKIDGENTTEAVLTGLEKYVEYNISVLAFITKGDGPNSTEVTATTDQDVPTGPPQNVRATNKSSTSIKVNWENVNGTDRNGKITGFKVYYQAVGTFAVNRTVIIEKIDGGTTTEAVLAGLEKYIKYNITVLAFTTKGDGPNSMEVTATTDQDVPNGPPRIISAANVSSTEIRISWENVVGKERNGIIKGFNIYYKAVGQFAVNRTMMVKTIDGESTREAALTDLEKFIEYNISVLAFTSKGVGPKSTEVTAVTDQDVPSAAPQNVTALNKSSTEITVTWTNVDGPERNGIILGFKIYYRATGDFAVNKSERLRTVDNGSAEQVVLESLEKFIEYTITVLAFTSKGGGRNSTEVTATTDQDVPSDPPQNVDAQNKSSTEITVTWKNVVESERNGIILGFKIYYRATGEFAVDKAEHFQTVNNGSAEQVVLGSLEKYIEYSITVLAFTSKGDGPNSTAVTARTDQDVPDSAPQNVTALAKSSTQLTVKWQNVVGKQRNGIVNGFKIFYQATGEFAVDKTQHLKTVNNGSAQSVVLESLEEYIMYSITVLAFTSKGDGPNSSEVTATTDQDVPTSSPFNISTTSINNTAIKVQFYKVPGPERNGVILSYRVTYQAVPGKGHAVNSALQTLNVSEMASQKFIDVILYGLEQAVAYSINVSAFTVKGEGPVISTEKFTNEAKPDAAPQNFTVKAASSTTINCSWKAVEKTNQNGKILGYKVFYKPVGGFYNSNDEKIKEVSGGETYETVLENLDKYVLYEVRILAYTEVGDGTNSSNKVEWTLEDKPDAAPQDFKVNAASSTAIQCSWAAVKNTNQNGKIIGYKVFYKPIDGFYNSSNEKSKEVKGGETYETVLENLDKYVSYEIRILAYTEVGDGTNSSNQVEWTLEDKPEGHPANVVATAFNYTTIQVTFGKVQTLQRNGIITEYEVRYGETYSNPFLKVIKANSLRKILISKRKPNTRYLIWVSARTSKGEGPRKEVPVVTGKNPDVGKATEKEFPFPTTKVSYLSTGTRVTCVRIIVQKLCGGKPNDLIEDSKLGTHLNASQCVPYITAEFKIDKIDSYKTFMVGDGKLYPRCTAKSRKRRATEDKGYKNAALKPGEKYGIQQRNYDAAGTGESLDWITIKTRSSPLKRDITLPVVLGIVCSLLVVIVIVIAVFVYQKRRKSFDEYDEDEEGAIHMQSRSRSRLGTMMGKIRRGGPISGIDHYHPGEPKAIDEFEAHVNHLHSNSDYLFSQEYASVTPNREFTWEHTLEPDNTFKNRYGNIVAYDHTRVVLKQIDGIPHSDYINANYLDGYQKKKAYIACQGPLPDTVNDFWRMVWEHRTGTIIMVTNLEERGRIKCHQYWPSSGTETNGDLNVTLLESYALSDYCVRKFRLVKEGTNEERIVKQFHYTAWPDHGVPSSCTSVLNFVRKSTRANPSDAGPMVVHCSAGVGRTGTYIVIDAMLKRIASEKTVDVFGYVCQLRCQRNLMVQVEEQYVFIHDVLLEAILCGDTEVPARDLRIHIKQLMEQNPVSGIIKMEEEFARLNKGRGGTAPHSVASQSYNKHKNRYANVLPFDDTRVKLNMAPGVEGSDYINASYIDGYMLTKAFIATQAPIPDTINDFWRMVWEQECCTLVMLSNEQEGGKVKVHRYWPDTHPRPLGNLVVEMTKEDSFDDYIARDFRITNTTESASRMVRQYHFTAWPDIGSPESGCGLIDVIGQVQRWQQQSGNNIIVAHCSAGVGRTGVFCAVSILIERLKAEAVVDVFQTVKQLREQRTAMVQTKDQYEFIYRTVQEYLDSFDPYNNFD